MPDAHGAFLFAPFAFGCTGGLRGAFSREWPQNLHPTPTPATRLWLTKPSSLISPFLRIACLP
jgi:hypothetical protein